MIRAWMNRKPALGAGALLVLLVLALGGCTTSPAARPSAGPSVPAPAASTPYQQGVDAAYQQGLRVWIETDLVKRWLAGKDSFRGAVRTVAALADRPGVVGIKIADELGYHDGLDSVATVRGFLADSSAALRAAAPGKLLLVDLLVPELGCLPGYDPPLRWATICGVQQRGLYPQLALDQVDGYLAAHQIDVVDLSTNLQADKTYAGWGVDAATAQRTAWQEAHRRGWDRGVRLQARKALAHPGDYPGSTADAQSALATFVDIPRAQGASAVDVWTWHQQYQGQMYRLMNPGLHENALWAGLRQRRAAGAHLFTHLSPRSVEVGLRADLTVLAQVFTDVFIAAGTG
jgi:hypothetical protein